METDKRIVPGTILPVHRSEEKDHVVYLPKDSPNDEIKMHEPIGGDLLHADHITPTHQEGGVNDHLSSKS